MNYETEIRQEVQIAINRANKLYAEKYHKHINMPIVKFSDRMIRAAGTAKNSRPNKIVTFSRPIIERNDLQKFKARTVWHEIAHIVQFELGFESGHNASFYRIMRDFGIHDATRCHSYVTPARKNVGTAVCQKCNEEFQLGAIRIRKIKQGTRYRHTSCGGVLILK